MTPTISRSSRRSSGPSPRKAMSISASEYCEALNRSTGPSPVPSQWVRTFSTRANSTRCAPDRCISLSRRQRRTTCGVTSNFFATASTDIPAASMDALTRAPNDDIVLFLPRFFFATYGSCKQGCETIFSEMRPHHESSLPRSLPRRGLSLHRLQGLFIRSVHKKILIKSNRKVAEGLLTEGSAWPHN